MNLLSNTEIVIAGHDISVKEYKGKRVVTFKDIDEIHKRVNGTAKRNFSRNKKHFIENVDYFDLTSDETVENINRYEFRTDEFFDATRGGFLITEP